MSQDKEREIQLQFLEEASDYLDTIESALLGLATRHIDSQTMDAVLRAAHSVKGGAGMMGFTNLSQLAHRLEDAFKVLKAQRNSLCVDESLESLLLAAVDRLRQVLDKNKLDTDVDEAWLTRVGNPVFDDLQERLGEPVADDATTMLGGEDGTNVAALLFETEVEGCLNRLEAVLADPAQPCLEEELSIMAQELGGLGEMLQLDAFTQLCESVNAALADQPDMVLPIAREALSAWRRTQALVLVGQVNHLPNSIDWLQSRTFDSGRVAEAVPSHSTEQALLEETSNFEVLAAEFEALEEVSSPAQHELTDEAVLEEHPSVSPLVETYHDTSVNSPNHEYSPQSPSVLSSDVRFSQEKSRRAGTNHVEESQENSVRIPVRQLERLGDLFGELTIERNGLSLHLGRLRQLIETLRLRMRTLEQSNSKLRTVYDTIATTGGVEREVHEGTQAFSTHSGLNQGQGPGYYTRSESVFLRRGLTRYPTHKAQQPSSSVLLAHTSGMGENPLTSLERFDALEMDRYSDLHLLSQEVMETIVQLQEVTSDVELELEETETTARELNQTAKQLQTNLTQVRMRPLSDLVGRFSRALRDLSLQYGKSVELKVYGKGTLIDRSILEALSDPLMHLVRNAFDHGIEDPAIRTAQGKPASGVIEIKAAHRGNQTIITISDDGSGINLNKIRKRAEAMGLDAELLAAASEDELLSLIFEPGFSTADKVTDLSGRGVGMDVVRNNLKQIRGDIRVDTTPGRGTTFTLTVPFTLSVARVLLVESNGCLLAFPTDVIEEMLLLANEQVLTTPGNEVLNWQGEMVPLIRMSAWLTFYCPRRVTTLEGVPSISEPAVLMISQGEQLVGLQVDRCWGEQEVAIRSVEGTLAMPPGFAGCTILGDGKVVPLVDAFELLRWIGSGNSTPSKTSERQSESVGSSMKMVGSAEGELLSYLTQKSVAYPNNPRVYAIPPSQKDTILVVDDSINVRRFLALALEKAGYLVEQAKDGQDAVEKLLGGMNVSAVICDIEMPRLDGYGFLARIKSDPAFSELPVAMLTSRSGEKHRQLAMTLGAAAYFSKPYNERELLNTIKQIITESRVRKPIPEMNSLTSSSSNAHRKRVSIKGKRLL